MSAKNTDVQVCTDASVTKHNYHVTINHTMGHVVKELTIIAGSKAHAALLAGIDLITEVLENGQYVPGVTMHNITDHLTLDVELLV